MSNVTQLPTRLSIAVAAHKLFLATQALGKYLEANREKLIEKARAHAPDHSQYAFPTLRVDTVTTYPITCDHEADHLGLEVLKRFMDGMVVNNQIDIGRVGYMEALGENCFIYTISNNPALKVVRDKTSVDPEKSKCKIGFVLGGWNIRVEVRHEYAVLIVRLDNEPDFS